MMMLVAPSAWGQTVVVDNTNPGFSVLSQTWSTATSAPGRWGPNYHFRNTTGGGTSPAGEVEWRPNLPIVDQYIISVYYPAGANRANNATYTIHHTGGTTNVAINQQLTSGAWVELGTFSFNAGNAGFVTLSSNANASVVIADAMKFVGVSNPPLFTEAWQQWIGDLRIDGRSASLADIDNDGDLDLFFQGGGTAQRLYRNNVIGAGTPNFTDISHLLPAGLGPSWSAAWGDYDGDGRVDVFVGQSNLSGSGDLLRNEMPTGFSNVSVATGLNDPGFHQSVAWCDINNDLYLDMVIAMEGPEKHEIYLQGPPGTFTAVGAAADFQQDFGTKAYGMAIGDVDGDGDQDVYISTCRADNNIRNNFYENQLVETGGALVFIDQANFNGTQLMTNSYHAEFQDFDDDGDLDLFVVGADGQISKIYRNDGGGIFTDVETILGHPLLPSNGGDMNGGRAIDYDNDGDLDLFFHDHLAQNGVDQARHLYRNDGNWQFTNVTHELGLAATNQGGYDSAWGDIDLDGDLDLIAVTNTASPQNVFISGASLNGNHWLFVRLVGTPENTTAIGAQLYATIHFDTPQQRTLRRDANANAGTFNQSDQPVHFGLGSAGVVDRLRIVWPNGAVRELCNVPVDQYVTLALPVFGDFDGDGLITDADVIAAADCLAGPVDAPQPASAACDLACLSAFDSDASGTIDLKDYAAMQAAIASQP